MKRRLRIGVSALNATDNPGPGVPVIRCLKESALYDIETIGLAYDALEPGVYMNGMASESYLMPYPSTGYSNMFQRIKEIHSTSPLNIILPVLDSELTAYMKMESLLQSLGIATFLPTPANFEMRSKVNLSALGKTSDIPVPLTKVVYTLAQVDAAVGAFSYPVVVKGVFYDAIICGTYEEVVHAFTKVTKKWGVPAIMQEFLKGDEYNIAAVGDGTGETLGAVVSKKMYITDKGKGWSGVAIKSDELLALTRNVIGRLHWRGALELEMMRSSKTGQYLLLEINPRFPAWIYLSAGVGINLPEMVVSLALGEKPAPQFDYQAGKMFVRYSADLILDIGQLEQITITSRYKANGTSTL